MVYKRYFKRILDVVLALTALLILSPFFVIILVVLAIIGKHPLFFTQERIGYKNKVFKIIKLNTMYKNADNGGINSLSTDSDTRVIPFRRFLRKTKIDELPQLLHVLKGSMSIVGARPQMPVDFRKYAPEVQKHIYDTLPGITGIGSIIFRNEEKWISKANGDKHAFYREHISPYKGSVELWYQNNISLKNDILIIIVTAFVLIYPKSELVYKIFKDLPPKPEVFNC
ncbi:MAG: sugar transferase [Pigmentiphaga sp.]|nr:sugar transferase [Pigmentiphaga sp.]